MCLNIYVVKGGCWRIVIGCLSRLRFDCCLLFVSGLVGIIGKQEVVTRLLLVVIQVEQGMDCRVLVSMLALIRGWSVAEEVQVSGNKLLAGGEMHLMQVVQSQSDVI